MSKDTDKKYTLENCNDEINPFFLNADIFQWLYKEGFLQRTGKITDIKVSFSEFYAEKILENLSLLKNIPPNERNPRPDKFVYYQTDHAVSEGSQLCGDEPNSVKAIVEKKIDLGELGTPLDFQIPLYNTQQDGYGEIDLLTISPDKNAFYMVEVKAISSEETALRALIEIATYFQQVQREILLKEYNKKFSYEATEIKKAVLFFKDTNPANEIQDTERQNLRNLARELEIEVFIMPLGRVVKIDISPATEQ